MPGRSSVWITMLHREALGRAARPFDIDLALDLVHQVLHVRADLRVHGDALAARDVADDRFPANRIAALGAIDHQVVDALNLDGTRSPAGPDCGALPARRSRRRGLRPARSASGT